MNRYKFITEISKLIMYNSPQGDKISITQRGCLGSTGYRASAGASHYCCLCEFKPKLILAYSADALWYTTC